MRLSKEVIMRISKALDWHIEGEIIDENPPHLKIDASYVENMKRDIIE
jgi:hypothetical protein